MTNISMIKNPKQMARTAGIIYLLIAVFGAFSIAYVPSQIIVPSDAAATLAQLQSQAWLFRAGIFADIVVIGLEIILVAILYFLLRPVDPVCSMVAAMARFAMILVMAINLFINATAFLMAQGVLQGSPETILTLFDIHAQGIFLWGVLFSIHLLVLGGLVFRSGYFPKLLGAAMAIGSFGYLIEGLSKLMGLENANLSLLVIALLTIVTIAELSFAVWLVAKGLHEDKWRLVNS